MKKQDTGLRRNYRQEKEQDAGLGRNYRKDKEHDEGLGKYRGRGDGMKETRRLKQCAIFSHYTERGRNIRQATEQGGKAGVGHSDDGSIQGSLGASSPR